ncbi:AfsR/SARP family transcriptional regulator, partial [Streptomyces sp. 8P21H-1]|uniref:AfsR/SARP family transcriptional regulator n=1 Tax=Streptomyces sp. 8P21H-1 TaxID=2737048 RepID=UPI0015711739
MDHRTDRRQAVPESVPFPPYEPRKPAGSNGRQAAAHDLHISVLGPLEARHGGRRLAPAPPKMRVVLALLAINPNRVVPADTFVEELWPHDPPVSAADTLYTYLYQLRKLIRRGGATGDAAAAIATQSPGYILRVDPANVDAEQYFVTARRGQEALDNGDAESASALLRSALGLWRGRPLADVSTGTFLSSYTARLQESRLSTLSQRIAADLSLKRHGDVVGELRALTVEHPFNERFSGQLMIALHGLGRRAEALEVYRNLRETLIRELGLEPSSETSRIQHAILRADAGTELVRGRPDIALLRAAPAQLPPDIADFTAREEQVAKLRSLVCAAPSLRQTAPRVALVTGMPGVGKTVLAVHVAHQARARYPDGQLYAGLRTDNGAAAPVEDVLAGFLRTVGPQEGRLPDSLDERTRLFRTWCADRRVLVVLDDAVSEAQVQPLLPAGSRCAVIVTSRR